MSDDEAVPSFDEPAQEAAYWRTKAQDLQDMLRIAQDSLDDFEQHSKELEDEMERELAQSAKKLEESTIKNEKLSQDKDEWKKKYQSSLLEHNKTLNEMSKEISQLTESRNIYKNKLRDIEMDNDELENAERMIRSSLADIENRYNQQMERTALMEEELLEKNQLQEDNQRLRDEIREMSEELAVLRDREFLAAETRTSTPAQAPSSQAADPGGLTLKDLTNKRPASTTGRPSSQASAGSQKDGTTSAVGLTRSPSSANATLPASRSVYALRTPMGPRTSLGHARKGSRDVRGEMTMTPTSGSPTTRDRQQLPSSRAARVTRTPGAPRISARPGQAGSSMRMMRDLNASMAALRNRINNAVTAQPGATYAGGDNVGDQSGSGLDRSAIPRPSSRLATSMSTAHGSPLGSSTATVTGKGPRPSFDGKSSIPVASASLARSGRRPSSRLSVGPTAAATASAMTAAKSGTAPSDPLASGATPSGRTSRAQGHERASSAAGHIRSTTPLDFLNSEPPAPPSGRPSSRSSFVPRDSLLRRRRSSIGSDDPDQAPASSTASTRIAGVEPRREPFTPTTSRRRGTTISASTATTATTSSTARRVREREGTPAAGATTPIDTAAATLRRKTTHRPSSSSGGSQTTSTAPSSSVAAYRESRLNHYLNVAHNGNGASSGTERMRPGSALGGEASGPPPVPSSWKVRGAGGDAPAASGKVSSRRNSGTWTLKHSQSRSGSGSHSRSSSISGES